MSALLTTTMIHMEKINQLLKENIRKSRHLSEEHP